MSLKVVAALKARQIFGTIMNAVSFGSDQYIVERKGEPVVAIQNTYPKKSRDRCSNYHIVAGGIDKNTIFLDDSDRKNLSVKRGEKIAT